MHNIFTYSSLSDLAQLRLSPSRNPACTLQSAPAGACRFAAAQASNCLNSSLQILNFSNRPEDHTLGSHPKRDLPITNEQNVGAKPSFWQTVRGTYCFHSWSRWHCKRKNAHLSMFLIPVDSAKTALLGFKNDI